MATTESKRCLGCGYILDHLPEPRCPECGRGVDPDRPETATSRSGGSGWWYAWFALFGAGCVWATTQVNELSHPTWYALLICAGAAQAATAVRSLQELATPRVLQRHRVSWLFAFALSAVAVFLSAVFTCLTLH